MKLNIVNSLQPQAIGDAVAAFPMLWELSNSEPLSIYFSCRAVRPLCAFAAVSDAPLEAPTLDIQDFARAAEMRGLHLVQSWFWRLGMPVPQPPFAWPPLATRPVPDHFDLAISPFSGSEPERAWPPRALYSKLWPLPEWQELLSRSSAQRVCVLCGNGDDSEAFREAGAFVLAGRDLREVCGVLRNTAVVVTIDNGISWLVQALGRPHVLLQSSRHLQSWTRNSHADAVNLPSSANASTVLHQADVLREGRRPPVECRTPFDRRHARLALLNAIWFAARRDREAAMASYRIWRQHASVTQFARAGLEALGAIGQTALAAKPRRSSKGASLSRRGRRGGRSL